MSESARNCFCQIKLCYISSWESVSNTKLSHIDKLINGLRGPRPPNKIVSCATEKEFQTDELNVKKARASLSRRFMSESTKKSGCHEQRFIIIANAKQIHIDRA